jgi:predicted TIM-barrel fold metal-dependent hydrolase
MAQKGYDKAMSRPLVILLVLGGAAVVLLGTAAFMSDSGELLMLDDEGEVARSTSCEGDLYDTHIHLDDDDFAERIAPQMIAQGVNCGVLFVEMNLDDTDEDFELAREALGETPGVFVPFFDVVQNLSTAVAAADLSTLQQEHGEFFKGFGEFAFYQGPDPAYNLAGADLTDQSWTTLFQFAGEHDLFVMLHPTPREVPALETAAVRYPNTRFLIHGFDLGADGYAALLKKYPNVFYTLDTATLLKDAARGGQKHLMYPRGQGNAAEFASAYDRDKEYFLQQAESVWAPVVLAAPDKVMWGTDISFNWHAEPEVYDRLVDFSKTFVATLPAEVQKKYAYQNAVRLFGKTGMVYQPADEDDDEPIVDDEEEDDGPEDVN